MIRTARPADAVAIAAIWNRVIRETVITFTTDEKDPRVVAAEIPARPFFVAEAAGEIAGFVTYGQFRGGPGYVHTVEHSIHIADGARGAGYGRALMAMAEDHARDAGVHSIFAGISGENAGGIAFHAALGYRHAAHLREVGWKFGRWHDLVLMQKML